MPDIANDGDGAKIESSDSDAPSPIGIWLPEISNGSIVFVRPDAARLGDDWAPQKTLAPKTTSLPLRVILIGESTAAGFFYAPHLTPAKVLEDQLREIKGTAAYEVIDLTKVDMPADGSVHDLVRVTVAALQLNPDVLVIFAGNNWLNQIVPFAKSGANYLRRFAPAYRQSGVQGVMDQCELDTKSHFQGVVTNLNYIAATVPVPMILVIPEVSADWARGLPVAWLAGDRTPRWHRLYAKARKAKQNGGLNQQVALLAEEMIELDQGTCPVSYRLLAETRFVQSRTSEARELFLREVDSASWHPGALPGANSTVRDLLRKGAQAPRMACVDLPQIFFEASGTIPGRDLFLDYCHLSLEGIKVAMAAVASQVLRLTGAPEVQAYEYRSLLRLLPEPKIHPIRNALAKFLAALYTIHWQRRFDGDLSMPEHWCNAAIEAADEIKDTMLDYVVTRIQNDSLSGLSLAEQRFYGRKNILEGGLHLLAGEGRRLRRCNVDPVAIELICKVLERSGRSVCDSINKLLVERLAVGDRPIDLVNPYYHWTTLDHLTSFQSDSQTFSGYGLYQAFWPGSDFCFISDGLREIRLDLTARLPSTVNESRNMAEAKVSLNGYLIGIARLRKSWGSVALNVGREKLKAGINRLSIHWPKLSDEGDAATNQIRERLEQGVPTNLEPVFGELQSLFASV